MVCETETTRRKSKEELDLTVETRIIADKEFKSLASEVSRTYIFDNQEGDYIELEDPEWLHVSKSGGHYVVLNDNECVYIPPGWIALHWVTHEGTGPIQI